MAPYAGNDSPGKAPAGSSPAPAARGQRHDLSPQAGHTSCNSEIENHCQPKKRLFCCLLRQRGAGKHEDGKRMGEKGEETGERGRGFPQFCLQNPREGKACAFPGMVLRRSRGGGQSVKAVLRKKHASCSVPLCRAEAFFLPERGARAGTACLRGPGTHAPACRREKTATCGPAGKRREKRRQKRRGRSRDNVQGGEGWEGLLRPAWHFSASKSGKLRGAEAGGPFSGRGWSRDGERVRGFSASLPAKPTGGQSVRLPGHGVAPEQGGGTERKSRAPEKTCFLFGTFVPGRGFFFAGTGRPCRNRLPAGAGNACPGVPEGENCNLRACRKTQGEAQAKAEGKKRGQRAGRRRMGRAFASGLALFCIKVRETLGRRSRRPP